MGNRLSIVVPCYNEEEVLDDTTKKLSKLLDELIKKNKIDKDSFILYCNDGSKDKTWDIIKKLNKENKYVYGLSISRNRGHQNVLYAGLMKAKDISDMVISIDADLQDDINVIEEMIDNYNNGYDIVYGVRNSRGNDSIFKKYTALIFYKIMKMMGTNMIYNHADFRLMSKRALEELANYKEVNLFLRGIVPLIGFKSTCVYYERKDRTIGVSKYSLRKMFNFAIDGITSFSTKPLTLSIGMGIIVIIVSIVSIIYMLFNFEGVISFILPSIWLLGGIQLLSLGIIGEYIGKMYMEVKGRPRYCVEEFLDKENVM